MRIGLVEFLLILAIASLTVGPQVALFVDRWMRRANRANARAARRRAEYAAQMAAERDALLKRFRTASTVFGVGILLALVYALVFRPIDTPPQAYTAPEVRQSTGAVQTALSADSRDVLALGDYQGVDCIREQDGFVYAAAYNGATLKKRKSDLVRTDGGSFSAILSVDGELTGFAFDADGDLWLTVLTPGGGALCRARHDSWGAAVEQVVTQIDGAPLGAVSAVEAGPDGKVYFAVAGGEAVDNGLEAALRTELLAHTGTGWVYVYDPADRSVQRVVGGMAGASGLALSPDGRTLYVSDLGNRCVWSMDADARELTAGGKNCQSAFSGLPGYPGALAMEADGTLYISYRWARSGWLEKNADSTLLRGIALRAGQNLQEKLFGLSSDAPCAEAVSTADGSWKRPGAALRSRPDRIIVGEVRGEEALSMLNAMNTGHDGSISTGHANSCKDMLKRIETMVLMGVDMPVEAIRGQMASAIDVIIHLGRSFDGSRKLMEISEITGIAASQVALHPLFEMNEDDELTMRSELCDQKKLKEYGQYEAYQKLMESFKARDQPVEI